MKINQFQKYLEEIKKNHGDIDIVYNSLLHTFNIEPVIKDRVSGEKVILVNP